MQDNRLVRNFFHEYADSESEGEPLLTIFAFIFIPFASFAAPPGSNVPVAHNIEINADPSEDTQYEWTLDETLKIAENQNPDLKAAKANFEAASKSVVVATSGYLPHVDIKAGFVQTTLPDPSAGVTENLGTALPYSSVTARLTQTLFDFGKVINQIGAAQASAQSAKHGMESVHDGVQLSVRKAFFNALAAQKLVDVAKAGVAQFQETLRRTSAFVKAGTRPSFDLTQANVELSTAKLKLVQAINARDLSHVLLLNLLGMRKPVTFKLKDAPGSEAIDIKKINMDELSQKAIQNRPEMKMSTFAMEAARLRAHAQMKEYFPTVSLEGWYGKYFPNYPSALADSYGGGLTISWALFDGLKTTGRIGELNAKLEAEESQLEREQEMIVADVVKGYALLKQATSSLALVTDNLEFAKENARLARKRYDSNVATFLELLVAQTTLLNAEATKVQAQYDYEVAVSTLKYAVRGPLF